MANSDVTRVSIVEDDLTIRETLNSLFIHMEDMEVFSTHATAEDALHRFGMACPEVVIMDINLPGQSGIDCVRQLSRSWPSSQFLMYTIHDDDHRVFEALKAGANGYILKESTPDQIIEAVRELKAGGAPMSAHVARRVVAHMRGQVTRQAQEELSPRENNVLELLAQGLLYKEIGERLSITTGTVKQHIHKIYGKLHVQNRTEAVNRYFGR